MKKNSGITLISLVVTILLLLILLYFSIVLLTFLPLEYVYSRDSNTSLNFLTT